MAMGIPVAASPAKTIAPAHPAFQFTLIYTFLDMYGVPLRYGTYEYPAWGTSLGVCIGVLTCLQIPLWAAVALCRESGTLSDVSVPGGMGHGDGEGVGAEEGLPQCWGRAGREQRQNRGDADPSPRERERAGAVGLGREVGSEPSASILLPAPAHGDAALCPTGLGAAPAHPRPPPALPESHPAPALLEDGHRPGCGRRRHRRAIHHHPDQQRLHRAAPPQQRRLMPAPGHPMSSLRALQEDGTRQGWGHQPGGWLPLCHHRHPPWRMLTTDPSVYLNSFS